MNEVLGRYGVQEGVVNPKVIRTDTTVMESNIHYPTDASLLWDTWRVAARLLKRAREISPESVPHRFHSRKIKKLYLDITRYSNSKSAKRQRKVRGLVSHADRAGGMDRGDCRGILPAIPLVARTSSWRRWPWNCGRSCRRCSRWWPWPGGCRWQGETVPASEKVFSIFEPHTELIKRGRREKPVEFGHKVLLCQTRGEVHHRLRGLRAARGGLRLDGSRSSERHEKLFGERPEVLAADKGFCPEKSKFEELAKLVENLAIPRRMQDFMDKVLAHWQAFRAGIEGTISGLKRAFRWFRCFFRGFKSFARNVGLGVFCHNLIVLAEHESG